MNTDELKKLAEAATPGGFDEEAERPGFEDWANSNGFPLKINAEGVYVDGYGDLLWDGWKARATLAAANLATVLELIAERDELLEALEKLTERSCFGNPETNGLLSLIVTGPKFRAARDAIAKAKGGAA